MKKTIIALIVLFLISAFTAVISLAVCGVELVSSAVEYGVEEYREYRTEDEVTANSALMLANNNAEADSAVCPICGETECRLDCEKEEIALITRTEIV